MRSAPALVLAVLGLFVTDAVAQGKNESTRRAAGSSSSASKSSSKSSSKSARSGSRSRSSSGGDFGECLWLCLDLMHVFGACSTTSGQQVTVVGGTTPHSTSAPPSLGPEVGFSLDAVGQWVIDENLILAPRLAARMDVRTPAAGLLRVELDHVTYAERVPVSAPGEHTLPVWDLLHLSGVKLGWLAADHGWEAGGHLGVRLLPSNAGVEMGLDLGLDGRVELHPLFFEAGAAFLVFPELLALEPAVRVGLSLGQVEAFAGWRALQFFHEGSFIPYLGPELGLRLRL